MKKVYYPAVFHKEKEGYYVEFPNLPGCFSQGETVEESYLMAKEALGYHLDTTNDLFSQEFEQPSTIEEVSQKYLNELIMLVDFDSVEYSKAFKNKAVKKTLSIPQWLNDLATKNDINFSQLLQEAIKEKLNLD